MTDMRAYLAAPHTDTPVLTTRPMPDTGANEVLVRVQAAALNNGDLAPVDTPHIPGFEFSGEIVAVGAGVDPNRRGQQVMGIAAGAFAEFVTAHSRHVLPIPDGIDHAAAATLPTALTTEYGAIRRSGLTTGDTVLVTAATSGIALLGLQVAKQLGADTIIGTTRDASRADAVRRAGADHVIITGTEDLADAVHAITKGRGADVVLDHVGGAFLQQAIQAARIGGAVVSVGRLGGARAEVDLFALARRQVMLQSVSYGLTPPELIGDLVDGVSAEVLPAVAGGTIRPVLDSTHPFDKLGEALARLRSGSALGKISLAQDNAPSH